MTHSFNRRSVLAGSLALGAGSLAMPRLAFAKGAGSKNIMFVILRGAADGLAMVAPFGDPDFVRQRPRFIGEYEDARRSSDGFFAIHPALDAIGTAFSEGDALFAHAIATSYRERSHFDGQNMLETGAAVPYAKEDGWLNRLVALMGAEAGTPPKALAISATIPVAMRGAAPVSNYAPSALPGISGDFKERVARLYANDAQLSGLWQSALETRAMAADDGLRNLRDAAKAGELAASLMREPDGARVGMIELGGWDTHVNQQGGFRRVGGQLDAMLGAYRSAMGSSWKDTMVIVATEFGRTVRINGTNGTDHGTAGAAIVMGGNIRGGQVIADWPGLSDEALYQNRDLRPTLAMQSLFAGATAEHLGLDPKTAMKRLFPDHTEAPVTGIAKG